MSSVYLSQPASHLLPALRVGSPRRGRGHSPGSLPRDLRRASFLSSPYRPGNSLLRLLLDQHPHVSWLHRVLLHAQPGARVQRHPGGWDCSVPGNRGSRMGRACECGRQHAACEPGSCPGHRHREHTHGLPELPTAQPSRRALLFWMRRRVAVIRHGLLSRASRSKSMRSCIRFERG